MTMAIAWVCGRYYAQAIRASGVPFDVLFGPAYKGIPLASGVAAAWYDLYGEDVGFAYNRKEVKGHGEVCVWTSDGTCRWSG